MAHLVLPDTTADPSQNQKSQISPPHQMTIVGILIIILATWQFKNGIKLERNKR